MSIIPRGPAAFQPVSANTTLLSANTATTTATIATLTTAGVHNIRVFNAGPNDCAIEFGPTSITAAWPTSSGTGSMVVHSGAIEVFSMRASIVAGVCTGAAATAQLYFTPGDGI